MYKLVTFSGYDVNGPHIFPIEGDVDRSVGHIKMARPLPPSIEQYIRTARPIPGKTQLLIDAMGAGEYYGSNVNGDYFPEEALRHDGPDYGHKTFELYAYPYKHHVNKDPARAYGEKVTLSAYDPHMHRVLLIVSIDDNKCQDILGDLANNKYWDVSMGCFMAGTPVTMADGTRKPIEQIQVGDEVITHLGRVRKVTEVHRRPYKGEMYSIRPEAGDTIRCTRQHPFLAVSHDDVKTAGPDSGHRAWRESFKRKPDWLHAECLDTDAHVLAPIPDLSTDAPAPSASMARMLGYYLAEGHVLYDKKKQPCGIELTTHVDDAVHAEIASLCADLKTANEPSWFQRANSSQAAGISVFDKSIAQFCIANAGQYSKTKRLSREVMGWDPQSIRNLIGAYANGDGSGGEDGSLKLSTASESLAHQLQLLLLRLGIPASLSALNHKPSPLVSVETTEYVVHIGKQWAQSLRPYCSKVRPVEVFKTKNSRKVIDKYLVTPIREIDAMYVETEVFNFEVEEDESYLVDGIAVHNCRVPWDECSICKNRAKNRGEYCTHLRYQMNKILQDGRRVFAYNRLPKFFDISFVTIGAEKASHVLKKVASVAPELVSSAMLGEKYYAKLAVQEKGAVQQKSAEIDKEVPSQPPPSAVPITPEDKGKLLSFMNDAGDVKMLEPTLPPPVIDRMAEFPLDEIFSTLTALGIGPKPQEFQRIILIKQGARQLADQADRSGWVFDETKTAGPVPSWARDMGSFSVGAINEKIAMLVAPYVKERSVYPEILRDRLVRMEKRADELIYNRNSPWYPMSEEEQRESSGIHRSIPISAALAAGFLAFNRAFPDTMSKAPAVIRILGRHPWLLPILASAGVAATVNDSIMDAPIPFHKQGALDAKNAASYHHTKVASALARLGLIPLAYMYSGMQQKRWEKGQQLNALDRFIAARPELFAMGAFAAGPTIGRGVKNLFKSGSASIDETIMETARRIANR